MRWFHESIDHLHVALLQRIIPKLFRDGVESPSLAEHMAAVRFELPPLTTARHYSLTAHTLVGPLRAGFQVHLGPAAALPVLVFHHGLGEMPYDKTFRGIFRSVPSLQVHCVAVRAPFHRHWLEFPSGLASMRYFLALCAVALRLGDAVRTALLEQGGRSSLVLGVSLGGFLTIMHQLLLGTADGYVPLLAGPDIAHVILSTRYSRLIAPSALAQPQLIEDLLNYREAFQASAIRRVFPLLAQYDLNMLYAHHATCYTASNVPYVTIQRGHITGGLTFPALRAHILACLQKVVSTTV